MKRICIDARRVDAGGIGRVTQALVHALAGSDQFETVALHPPGMALPHGVKGLETAHLPLSKGDMTQVPTLLNAEGFDLFVAPQFYAPLGLRAPMVSWVHDVWPLVHPEWLPPLEDLAEKHGQHAQQAGQRVLAAYHQARNAGGVFPDNGFLKQIDAAGDGVAAWNAAMFALNLARCAHIVTCSNSSRDTLTTLFPEITDRINVIYNPLPEAFATLPNLPRGPRLLHVSKWEPRKNIVRLINAFARVAKDHPDMQLVLVGAPVNPSDREAVAAAIAQTGLADRIECLSGLSDAELAREYARARAFIMPSLDEGFSIPLIEAMAARLPIAAARVGAMPEVAGMAALFFDPKDEADIARAIAQLWQPEAAQDLVSKGRARLADLQTADFKAAVQATIETVLAQTAP